MEMMASLPSVVLGFLAALVLAPLVEQRIASVLAARSRRSRSRCSRRGAPLAAPAAADGAPPRRRREARARVRDASALGRSRRLPVGAAFERAFFGGDFRRWLDGRHGQRRSLLFLLLLPFALLLVGRVVARAASANGSPRRACARALRAARAGLARRRALARAGWPAAAGSPRRRPSPSTALGADPRGGIVGTYVQRNTLVVGFAMGFAVIPIIYTIAEDAVARCRVTCGRRASPAARRRGRRRSASSSRPR